MAAAGSLPAAARMGEKLWQADFWKPN